MREMLPYAALAVSVIACAISAWTAIRAGRWRNSEAHAALVGKVDRIDREQGRLKDRVKVIEDDLAALPTKADMARLEGEIIKVCAIADRTELAVNRLQEFLMKDGR